MQLRPIYNSELILGSATLVGLVTFWNSMNLLLPGLLYFMAAVLLCTASICVTVILHRHNREASNNIDSSSLQTRAKVFGLVAWQLAIIGSMNISSADFHKSVIHLVADYVLLGLFFVASYRIVSIADSPEQKDGYRPFNFFGYPRTRRLIFAVFAVYCTICPIILASLEFSIGTGGWRPIAFQSSQACLLAAAIVSTLSAGLILQRYRGVTTEAKRPKMWISVVTMLFLLCAAAIQVTLSYRVYVYILSFIAVTSSAVALSSLWQIGENLKNNNETIPNRAVSQHPLHP
jgi:hypothetical protein